MRMLTTVNLSFNDYLNLTVKLKRENPNWRTGQTYFNTLNQVRQDLADAIRGTNLDPFYVDSKVPQFLAYVCEHWNDQPTNNL